MDFNDIAGLVNGLQMIGIVDVDQDLEADSDQDLVSEAAGLFGL